MQLIEYTVRNQSIAQACVKRDTVAGSDGFVFARFDFDQEWDGLTITVFFENDSVPDPVAVIWNGSMIGVPPQALVPGTLRVSALGLGVDPDGNEVRLTTRRMEKGLRVYLNGAASGLPEAAADPALWEQVVAIIGPLSDLDTFEKSTLVGAINEVSRNTSGAVYVTAMPGADETEISLSASWNDIETYIRNGREVVVVYKSEFYRPINSGAQLRFILFDSEMFVQKSIFRKSDTSVGYKENTIKETDPTVPNWAKQSDKPTYTAKEVGALSEDALQSAINKALHDAASSGEFNGKDGASISSIEFDRVSDGGAVYNVILSEGGPVELFVPLPQRGTDYWTEADKSEIVADVLGALPIWEGGEY